MVMSSAVAWTTVLVTAIADSIVFLLAYIYWLRHDRLSYGLVHHRTLMATAEARRGRRNDDGRSDGDVKTAKPGKSKKRLGATFAPCCRADRYIDRDMADVTGELFTTSQSKLSLPAEGVDGGASTSYLPWFRQWLFHPLGMALDRDAVIYLQYAQMIVTSVLLMTVIVFPLLIIVNHGARSNLPWLHPLRSTAAVLSPGSLRALPMFIGVCIMLGVAYFHTWMVHCIGNRATQQNSCGSSENVLVRRTLHVTHIPARVTVSDLREYVAALLQANTTDGTVAGGSTCTGDECGVKFLNLVYNFRSLAPLQARMDAILDVIDVVMDRSAQASSTSDDRIPLLSSVTRSGRHGSLASLSLDELHVQRDALQAEISHRRVEILQDGREHTGHAFVGFKYSLQAGMVLQGHRRHVASMRSATPSSSIPSLFPPSASGPTWMSGISMKFAPSPDDIQWSNLGTKTHENFARVLFATLTFLMLMLVVQVPSLILHQATNIIAVVHSHASTTTATPPAATTTTASEGNWKMTLITIISKYLSSLFVFIVNVVYGDYISTSIVAAEKNTTVSRDTTSKFYKKAAAAFITTILYPLLVMSAITQFFTLAGQTKGVEEWELLFGRGLVQVSAEYFVQYILHAVLWGGALELLDINQVVMRRWWMIRASTRQERESAVKKLWPNRIGRRYAQKLTLFFVIVLFGCTIPILLPLGLILFATFYTLDLVASRRLKCKEMIDPGLLPTCIATVSWFHLAFATFCLASYFLTTHAAVQPHRYHWCSMLLFFLSIGTLSYAIWNSVGGVVGGGTNVGTVNLQWLRKMDAMDDDTDGYGGGMGSMHRDECVIGDVCPHQLRTWRHAYMDLQQSLALDDDDADDDDDDDGLR